ncbi:MAG: tRNA (adenine(22)-N(1))-methyltransferase [Senegalia sp. (in: firmicutes)]|uniref:tRNA (adenine(22)-N(1))-methyltransferase n=1 Tax=Senegalia sp. (in: firmicutes) TaxID=1924098 RepID=UPI003F9AD010
MNLSPRLLEIAKMVDENTLVADIGTDHGYIPVYLIENQISKKVIACDINEAPLQSAINYINTKKLNEKIDTRLGDGLSPINIGEVDTAIIAGMGGILITNILDDNKDIVKTIEKFILQPMIASSDLRKYLYKNNYKIIDEKLVREDNRFYEIIVAVHGKDQIKNNIYYEIGKKLIEKKDPLLKLHIEKKIKKTKTILENIEKNSDKEKNQKYIELKKRLSKLEVIYNDCKNDD